MCWDRVINFLRQLNAAVKGGNEEGVHDRVASAFVAGPDEGSIKKFSPHGKEVLADGHPRGVWKKYLRGDHYI